MRLKSHTFRKFGILALAVTLISVLPGPTAHVVEITIELPTVGCLVMVWQVFTDPTSFPR
jgi:hypothetical protein